MEFSMLSAMGGAAGFMGMVRMDKVALGTARAFRSLGKKVVRSSLAKARNSREIVRERKENEHVIRTPITKLGQLENSLKEGNEFFKVPKRHLLEVKNAIEVLNTSALKYEMTAELSRKDLQSLKKALEVLVNEAIEVKAERDSRLSLNEDIVDNESNVTVNEAIEVKAERDSRLSLNEDIVDNESNVTASKAKTEEYKDDIPQKGDKKPKKGISRLFSMMKQRLTLSETKLINKIAKKGKNKSDSEIGDMVHEQPFTSLLIEASGLQGPHSNDHVRKQMKETLMNSKALAMSSKYSLGTDLKAGPSGSSLGTTVTGGRAKGLFGTNIQFGRGIGGAVQNKAYTFSEESLNSDAGAAGCDFDIFQTLSPEEIAYQEAALEYYSADNHKPEWMANFSPYDFVSDCDYNNMASTSSYVPKVKEQPVTDQQPSTSKYTLYEQKIRAALRAVDDVFDQNINGPINKKISKSFDGYMNKLIEDDQNAKFSVAYDIVQDAPTDIYF